MDLAQQVSIILIVFGLLAAVLWLLRSRGMAVWSLPSRSHVVRRLKVLERLPLTPHHSLHVVQFDGRTLVVGVSPAGCQVLSSSEPPAGGAQ